MEIMRILLVEDDSKIASFVQNGLLQAGFNVDSVEDGQQALDMALSVPYDAAVVDIMLPKRDGLSLIGTLRQRGIETPILILSARHTVDDRISGLRQGADDYMVKPFGFRELVARIRAVLRRTSGSSHTEKVADSPLKVGDLLIDPRTRQVSFSQRRVALTPREYDLLLYLAGDPETVHVREQIVAEVWDENWWGSTKTLDVHIASLRKKLRLEIIETVRGVGFRLVAVAEPE